MTDNLPITDAEQQVMEALWEAHPLSSAEITAAVQPHTGWNAKTIQTLIGRLAGKDMIRRRKQGRRYYYSPAIAEEEFLQRKSRHFVKSFFGGKVTPLVASFAQREELSRDDIEQLRELVDSLDNHDREASHD